MAEITVGDAVLRILGDSTQAQQAVDQLGKSANKSLGQLSKQTGKWMTGIGATITGTLGFAARSFMKTADTIDDIRAITGMSTDAIQDFIFAFERAGFDASDAERALRRFGMSMQGIKEEADPTNETLNALGLTLEDLERLAPEEVFMRAVDALGKMEDTSRRNAVAADLMGTRLGPRLARFLEQGREGIEEASQALTDMGGRIEKDGIGAAAKFDAAVTDMKRAVSSAWNIVGEEVVKAMTGIAHWLSEVIPKISRWMRDNQELVGTLVKVGGAVGAVFTALGPLLIMLPGIATAVKGVIAAFTAVKVILIAVAGVFAIKAIAIVAAVAAVVAAAWWLWDNWEDVWDSIKDLVVGTLEWIGTRAGELTRAFVDAIMDPIGTLKTAWEVTWKSIAAVLLGTWNSIKMIFGWLIDGLDAVRRGLGWIGGTIGDAFGEAFVGSAPVGGGGGPALAMAGAGGGGGAAFRGIGADLARGGGGGGTVNVAVNVPNAVALDAEAADRIGRQVAPVVNEALGERIRRRE